MKKQPTKKEREYMSQVAALGCVVCKKLGNGTTSPDNTCLHHTRAGQGMGTRSRPSGVIPLCPTHHQTGGYGVAFHAGRTTWEKNYGTEAYFLEVVKEAVNGTE